MLWEAVLDSLKCVRFSSVVQPKYSVLNSVIIYSAFSYCICVLLAQDCEFFEVILNTKYSAWHVPTSEF